ncbi:MAG: Smr/MutS family protein [Parvibaculaceae bacterium]
MSRRRRELVPDLDLWITLARGIKPLDARRKLPEAEKPKAAPQHPKRKDSSHGSAVPVTPVRKAPALPPPLGGVDRRTQRRLLRGDVEIEARIDLHGESVASARLKLLGFVARGARQGLRTVLVITGKGPSPFARHTLHGLDHYHAPEREGRLRRLATEWFSEPEFRAHVAAFQPAHPKHGGGGAFYVRLRRPKG